MFTSVRGCICNGEVGGSRPIYELSMMAQVSNSLPGLLNNQAVLVIIVVVVRLVTRGKPDEPPPGSTRIR